MTTQEKRLLGGCLSVYLLAYTGRLNLSAALPAISDALSLNGAQAGMFQTVFAAVYALGQLVNGLLVDRVSPKRFVAAGLAGSAICNLLMGSVGRYPQMLFIWALNGAFQSMLWTPIMRLIARGFRGYSLRRACSFIAFAPSLGHISAWGIAGLFTAFGRWRWAFRAAGAVLAFACMESLVLLPGGKGAAGAKQGPAEGHISAKDLFWTSGFLGVLLLCVCEGFVRDGVISWTPTIISRRAAGMPPALIQLIVPGINLFSIALGGAVMRRYGGRPRIVCAAVMFLVVLVCALIALCADANALLLAALMGLTCLLIYGMNPTLVSMVPVQYAAAGRVGVTAGLIDSCIYVGSGLSGALGGAIQENLGVRYLFIGWTVFSLAGVAAMLWANKRLRGEWQLKSGG